MMPAAPQSLILVLKQDLSQVVVVSTLTMDEISKHTGAHHVQNCSFRIVITTVLHDQTMTTRSFRSVNNIPTIFESVGGGHFSPGMFSGTQGGQHLRNVPFPRGGNVYEVEIITSDESFEVSFSVRVNAGCLLTGLLDHLCRTRALLFHDITNGINDYLVNSKKFSEHLRATKTNADDSKTDNVVRFKPDANHCSLLCTTSLHCFFFRRICPGNTRRRRSYTREAGHL